MNNEQDTKNKRSLSREILDGLRSACSVFPESFRLELRGSGELYICGCRKISSYTREAICVHTDKLCVRVRGEGLTCASFHCSGLVIEGKIIGIDMESVQ